MKSFDNNSVSTAQHNDEKFPLENSFSSENNVEDPLGSATDVREPIYYKLDKVVFAEPIESAIRADSNEESGPCEDVGKMTFIESVTIKKQAGKRNKYFIDITDGSLNCPLSNCNRQFTTTTLLKAHIRKVHCASARCVCEQCGARFSAPYLLQRHSAVHSGRRVQCTVCGKQLSERTNLSAHQRTHGAARPHACSHCQRRFLRLSSLHTHMQFVHRDGDIPCNVCGARFSSRTQWSRHRATHAVKSPCDICGLTVTKRAPHKH